LPWWQQDAYLDGMNQYFEWEVKLAGGKTPGGSGSSSTGSNQQFGGDSEMDIGSLVPIQKGD
jgi:hypothetical protein